MNATCPSLGWRAARFAVLCLGLAVAPARADSVIGQVVNPGGIGLAGITLKFSNGLPNAVTGANGLFAVTVPAGTYDIAFEPATTYAPRIFLGVPVAGTANMGTVRLEFGFPVSGHVVDNANVPLAGGNVDVYDQVTGVKLYTPADSIDVLGNFLVTVPVGTCIVRVKPPSGRILVAIERENVVVSAPVNIGTVILPPGVVITGTVVDGATLLPVFDADIDVNEALSGASVVTPGDNTNAAGVFSVIAPPGLLHLAVDPPAGNSLLGKQMLNVYAPGPRNLGTIALAHGSLVRGRVLTTANAPVVNADLNAEVAGATYKAYLSHDKTDANGNFEIVVPDGSYHFVVQPKAATGLTGVRTAATTVAGTTVLPDFLLPAGVFLSGLVRGQDGNPEAGVNIDVLDPATNLELVTADDVTNINGVYNVVVPNGTWNVVFSAKKASFSRTETVPGVVVNGNTTLDRQLALVPAWVLTQGLGIPTVPQGGPVLLVLGLANPTASLTVTRASLWFVDPTGARFPLLANLDIPLPPGASATSINFLPLPPANPILLGKPFEYEVRLDDPITGLEHDRDHITFIIQ